MSTNPLSAGLRTSSRPSDEPSRKIIERLMRTPRSMIHVSGECLIPSRELDGFPSSEDCRIGSRAASV